MKPILFNTDMVRTILEGRKTQTRRVMKSQPPATSHVLNMDGKFAWAFWEDGETHWLKTPYQPGDILYVPEAWKCRGTFGELGYEVEFRDGQHV